MIWPTYITLVLLGESCSVVSKSLQPHGLYSPWNSPGQNTGVCSFSLIFPTQGFIQAKFMSCPLCQGSLWGMQNSSNGNKHWCVQTLRWCPTPRHPRTAHQKGRNADVITTPLSKWCRGIGRGNRYTSLEEYEVVWYTWNLFKNDRATESTVRLSFWKKSIRLFWRIWIKT